MTPPYSPPHCEATHPPSAAVSPAWQPKQEPHPPSHTAAPQQRFQCTSVIRHTADGCCRDVHPVSEKDGLTLVHIKQSKRDLNFGDSGAATQQTLPNVAQDSQTQMRSSVQDDKSNTAQCPPSAAAGGNGVSVPVYCQILPVSSLSTTVIQKSSTASESPLQHPLPTYTPPQQHKQQHALLPPQTQAASSAPVFLLGGQVAQAPLMLLVSQPAVPTLYVQPPLVSPGGTKFPAIAPAPGRTSPEQRQSLVQPEVSRVRSHVCPRDDCNKTYFKSSHLKAHMRTHTGTEMDDMNTNLPVTNRKKTWDGSKSLISICLSVSHQVRSPTNASGRTARGDSLAPTSCLAIDEPTRGRKSLSAPCATAASCAATTWPSTPAGTWQWGGRHVGR